MCYARILPILNTVIKSPAVMWKGTPFCYEKIVSVDLIASVSSGLCEWSAIKLLVSFRRRQNVFRTFCSQLRHWLGYSAAPLGG